MKFKQLFIKQCVFFLGAMLLMNSAQAASEVQLCVTRCGFASTSCGLTCLQIGNGVQSRQCQANCDSEENRCQYQCTQQTATIPIVPSPQEFMNVQQCLDRCAGLGVFCGFADSEEDRNECSSRISQCKYQCTQQ